MVTWSKVKELVEAQMARDPQRATLSTRAIAAVEEGLRHLASVGHQFELAPKGTIARLMAEDEPEVVEQLNLLSIADANGKVAPLKAAPKPSEFEAQPAGTES